MKAFPKTIYVRQDEDGDYVYFIAFDSLPNAIEEDGVPIARYTLRDQGKSRVTKQLVSR